MCLMEVCDPILRRPLPLCAPRNWAAPEFFQVEMIIRHMPTHVQLDSHSMCTYLTGSHKNSFCMHGGVVIPTHIVGRTCQRRLALATLIATYPTRHRDLWSVYAIHIDEGDIMIPPVQHFPIRDQRPNTPTVPPSHDANHCRSRLPGPYAQHVRHVSMSSS